MIRTKNGFTLVELAIVMIIVGLLLGGVLYGQKLISNAQLKITIAGIKAFSAAHYAFIDTYDAIPGDMAHATSRLPGCDASTFCVDGDGDRILGTRINNTTDISTTPTVQENIQYWKHLAIGDFVSGITFNADNDPSLSSYNSTHPEAAVGSGWNAIMTDPAGAGDYGGAGIIYQLTGAPNTNDLAIEPLIAEQIDLKIDDGRPNTGAVTAEYASSSNCDDDATNSYQILVKSIQCILYVEIE